MGAESGGRGESRGAAPQGAVPRGAGEAKRVLYHLRTQGTGSEGIHIRGMVTAFRALGYTVDFIWPLGEGDPTVRAGVNPYEKKGRKSRLESIVPLIPGPVFALLEFSYNLWAYRRFSAALKSRRYEFIYERHYFFSFAAGIAARRFKVPLVVEVNELAGFERVRKNYLTGLARRCERSLFRNAAIVSVVSTFLKDTIVAQYPDVSAEKIHVIPNGIERSFLERRFDGAAVRTRLGIGGRKTFGFVGFFLRVTTWHALEWFLPIFIEAVKDRPDAVLLLVGDGPGRENLEEIARSRGFSDRLFITGDVPNREIGHYLAAMDVGIIPHTNEYRSPIKLFEYMAFGKPVLAPRQEPVESIVGAVQGEWLFEAKNEESLKKAIGRVLADASEWPRAGAELEKMVRERFTYEKHGETIVRLLEPAERSGA